jgi:aminomethyltransferase
VAQVKKTPLHDQHCQSGAKMVEFHGWSMPIQYGSQLKEHEAVRTHAGVFDVSHMTIVDIHGPEAKAFLQYLLANDVDKLQAPGKALYTPMLNEEGGILDDLIVYRSDYGYRMVVNCATREQDILWMQQQASDFAVEIREQPHQAMLAIQGPKARALTADVLPKAAELIEQLALFEGKAHEKWFIARTGYTGEDGLEIILPSDQVADFWQALLAAGIQPCGLGARDTLRLEAGLNLYGSDMDETTSPLTSNMAWTIAWEPSSRHFIGKEALLAEKEAGIKHKLVGLVIEERAIIRAGQSVVVDNEDDGLVTSGSFSPTLQKSIAIARIPNLSVKQVEVEIRGKTFNAKVVKLPFVRKGQATFN